MGSSPPPPLDDLLQRNFSFYPPIHGVDHNEWSLVEGKWAELVVRNVKSGIEVGIPRRWVGEVSEIEEPMLIVGLTRELEYKSGAVWPYTRKVLAMGAPPRRVLSMPGSAEPPAPSALRQLMGTGSEGPESHIGKMIGIVFLVLVTGTFLVWAALKFTPKAKPTFVAKDQAYLELSRNDDYYAVVRKLGQPGEVVVRPGGAELHYRRLSYPDRGYHIILMGADFDQVRYIGTLNINWQPLHYVESPGGTSTASLLRTLKRF